MGDGSCPGVCNNRARRLQAAYKLAVDQWDQEVASLADGDEPPPRPVPPDIRPWPGEPVWCPKCQSVIRAQLIELDDLAALIDAIPPLARPADDGAGRVAGTREARTASPRMDDLEDFGGWLRSWEAAALAEDDPRPRRGFLARESTTITAWLYRHFDELIINPLSAADFGREIQEWHRNMAHRAAAGRITRHQKKPCPRCGLFTLWMTIGEDYIKCINEDCNRRLTRAEYDLLGDAA